jgi:hypothetical protein
MWNNSRKALFAPVADRARLHPQFAELLGSPLHQDARVFMQDLAVRMGDPNGNFVRDFQTDGFHSRLFELGCFAYLEEAGLVLDRTHEQPDFLVSRGGLHAALEAVTANPPTGQATDISLRNMVPLSDAEIFEKVSREFPRRMSKALVKKLKHAYHELPHCSGKPLVLVTGPFFEAGANFYTDDALFYPLYGTPDGRDEFEPFFRREDAQHVSAVLFCNQFTVSKFLRLCTDFAAIDWMRAEWVGTCFCNRNENSYGISHFKFELGLRQGPKEMWAHGVTLFENPFARLPLPQGLLPASSRVFVDDADGMVTREVGAFHPVTSSMQMHVAETTPDHLWKPQT